MLTLVLATLADIHQPSPNLWRCRSSSTEYTLSIAPDRCLQYIPSGPILTKGERSYLTTFPAHETGHPELLLLLHGTLPATFRGATYNIPIHLWLPQRYPHQAPMAFVVPHKDMLIRAGNHVDGNGRCYHPYLTGWGEYFDVGARKLAGL